MMLANDIGGQSGCDETTVQIVSDLWRLLRFSLACYVSELASWADDVEPSEYKLVEELASTQRAFAVELEQLFDEIGAPLPEGHFPVWYASLNDADWDYLLRRLLMEQHQLVAKIEELAAKVPKDDPLADVVAKILESQRQYALKLADLAGTLEQEKVEIAGQDLRGQP